jgi:hypothetical protein
MCRITGLPLLIKINKNTTKGERDDIFAIVAAFTASRY